VLEGLGKSRGTACTYRENTNWYPRAVSSLTVLTSLELWGSSKVTDESSIAGLNIAQGSTEHKSTAELIGQLNR
jgi:hypothetical protein